MPILSLIMAAYNAESTCAEAIYSACNNTYDIEIIVIDDGSTDKTLEICKAIQKKDPRIKVHSKQNGGVSSARNLGLKFATGKYVGFIDSDDKLSEDYFRILIPQMQKGPDMIVFGYTSLESGKYISGWRPKQTTEVRELYEELLFHGGGLNSPWNKLFKKSLLHISFNEKKDMGEDLEFCCDYLQDVETCSAIPVELYLYNTDVEGSLTKNLDQVLGSVVNDMNVLNSFTRAVGIDENLIAEKFYQRIEGILGNINKYNVFEDAIFMLFKQDSFNELIIKYLPRKGKNSIIRKMILYKKWKTMFVYLACKRYARFVRNRMNIYVNRR